MADNEPDFGDMRVDESEYEARPGFAHVLVPSGFCIVPVPTEDEVNSIEILQMKITELEAVLEDRRIRVQALEAALHAAHHDERPVEVLFDVLYSKLIGGSVA